MITADDRATIDQPVERVFSFVADTTNDPVWHTDLLEVRRLDQGPIGAGTEFDVRIKPFMGQSTGHLKVTRFEPNEVVEMDARMGAMSPTIRYTFRPSGAGTEVRRTIALQPPGLMRLIQPLVAPMFARRNRSFLENLKRVLETT